MLTASYPAYVGEELNMAQCLMRCVQGGYPVRPVYLPRQDRIGLYAAASWIAGQGSTWRIKR